MTTSTATNRRRNAAKTRTATHRPAVKPRRFKHDSLVAVDLFSGFGGLTKGIEMAGFDVILAANHNEYKIDVHAANNPGAAHWIADLVDPEAGDYHSAADLPRADLLAAGVSCTSHSQANTEKAYEQGLALFEIEDPEYDARVTKSERDRATALCVLQYAAKNHPRMIIVECTAELQSWGPAVPGKKKVGDGSTYRWWLKEHVKLGYDYRELYLNSQFFGVPQSRNRLYVVFWDRSITAPDLEHRPLSRCDRCDQVVPAVWTWKTGIPPTGKVDYGKQYNYRCPRCSTEVVPPFNPSLDALDLSDLGTRIGDRESMGKKPLAPATMDRAERCRQRFARFPAVLMPAKSVYGTERHPWQPMSTQTSQQETALLSTGAVVVAAGNTYEHPGSNCRTRGFDEPLWTQTATNTTGMLTPPVAMAVDNFQGGPRGVDEPLPTQVGSETMALVTAVSGVVPLRKNAAARGTDQTLPTLTGAETVGVVSAGHGPGLLTAAGTIKMNGSIEEAQYRSHPVSNPLGTVVASGGQAALFSGWFKQNGSEGDVTAAHPLSDPLGTVTGRDTTGLLTAEAGVAWLEALAALTLEDCHFRMLMKHEVGRGCGFDVDFPGLGYKGTFVVWGSSRAQVDGFGNAVSPAVGEWIGRRCRAALHGS